MVRHLGKPIDERLGRVPLLLLFERDVFSFIRGILKVQGPGTTKVAKVKGRGG